VRLAIDFQEAEQVVREICSDDLLLEDTDVGQGMATFALGLVVMAGATQNIVPDADTAIRHVQSLMQHAINLHNEP
jgi:sarcosine oxidase gamma subunit